MGKATAILVLVTAVLCASSAALGAQGEILLTFEGAAVESLTLEEFLALPQLTVPLTRTNSRGKTTTGIYTGVHWKVLAEAIGAEHAKFIQVIASDGFEQVYPLDVLEAEDSLSPFTKTANPLLKATRAARWFCASEEFTANYWTKYIVKIVVR